VVNFDLEPDLSELSDYTKWLESDSTLSLIEYAAIKLTPDLAIATSKLFWPDFIAYEGGIFLSYRFNMQSFELWKKELNSDIQAIERMINHTHLAADLLVYPFENLSYTNIQYFAGVLMRCWQCALETKFPNNRFEVIGEKDGSFDDFVITFYQPS
jgi:hypothetical protein